MLAGVVNSGGQILSTAKRATKPEVGAETVADRIVKTVREAVEDAGLELTGVAGVCSGARAC